MAMKFCVIGVGRFGYAVATTLANRGMEVLAVDSDEQIIESIKDLVSHAICMEITNEESLVSLGLDDMTAIIVAVGEHFDQSILITALLKQNLKFPRVIVRSISDMHKKILKLIGADQIILPEQEIGTLLADNLSLRFESLAIITPQFSISKVEAPKKFVGKALAAIHDQFHVVCIGKESDGEFMPIEPKYVIKEADILLLSGSNKDLDKISKL
ncbi:MAG: TrkA family potassium uptake protein [Candidatus Babeliaceae bacterium]|nr:TrkA family potassium uptake protein [Candidatus Babeliaceae bacterium]